MLDRLTKYINQRLSLSPEQTAEAIQSLINESVSIELKAEFLAALATKGETVEEIAAFARELRALAVTPPIDSATRQRDILDVCGMGGDRLNTFNISSTVALIVAAAGVPVAKHGNRAVTSQSGSADVLEALGIPIDLPPDAAAQSLRDHHFAFFFAPNYHPAFRHIGPVRKLCAARGHRTIFNILGPLLNPARPSVQLVGVPRAELCEPIGQVLKSLGVRRGMVVCGRVGEQWLDELSILGENMIAEFYHDRGFNAALNSFDTFSFQACVLQDLAGGNSKENAQIIRAILNGQDRGPRRDAVLINCAAALVVSDKVRSLVEGWELSAALIDNGKASAKLQELSAFRRGRPMLPD